MALTLFVSASRVTGSNRVLPRGYLTLPLNHLPHKQVLSKEGTISNRLGWTIPGYQGRSEGFERMRLMI